MPTAQRQPERSVIQRLRDEPYRFQFVQAMRVIDAWTRRDVSMPDSLDQVVRFRNRTSMAFPASEIDSISVDSAAASEVVPSGPRQVSLTPAFIGLLGATGVLPFQYTDYAQGTEPEDGARRAFFDIVSHRTVMLFYRAWERSQVRYRTTSAGADGFLPIVLAVGGTAAVHRDTPAAAIDRDSVAAYYAGILRHQSTSAHAMAGVLTDYFGVPIEVQQFIGTWVTLVARERTGLGTTNCTLGDMATLGTTLYQPDGRIRLRIGPLDAATYRTFLPNAHGTRALDAMLALFRVANVGIERQLVLRAADVRPTCLGRAAETGIGLGFGTFLITRPATTDRNDCTTLRDEL